MTSLAILIVEDIESTLTELLSLLAAVFPNAKLEAAKSVDEALSLIDQARAGRRSYDIAILDFKLPAVEGAHPEVDVRLCQAILNWAPRTPIAHITAYPDDPAIRQHLEHVHPSHKPRGFLIDKLSAIWASELVARTRECLYRARVEAEYDEIFGEPSGAPRLGSLSGRLAELCADVTAYWPDLDDRLRTKVRQRLKVEDGDSNSVRVSLL